MRELSVAEQRYRAVLAVISDGRTVTETAAAVGGVAADGSCLAGQVRGVGIGGSGRRVASAVVVAAADAGAGGGCGVGGAAEASVVGSAADRGRGQQVGWG